MLSERERGPVTEGGTRHSSLRVALALGVLACSTTEPAPDPCTVDGVQTNPPVACGTARLTVLARYEVPSARWAAQIGTSHQSIVLDGTDVYWSDVGGRVLRTPKLGGPTEELLPDSGCSISGLAADDVFLFFSENCRSDQSTRSFPVRGRLVRMNKATRESLDLALTQFAEIRSVQLRGDQVYFTMATPGDVVLRVVGRDGPTVPADAPSGAVDSLHAPHLPFALGAADVYYGDNVNRQVTLQKADGTTTTVATSDNFVSSIAFFNGMVHWLDWKVENLQPVYALWRVRDGVVEPATLGPSAEYLAGEGDDYYGAADLDRDSPVTVRLLRWRSQAAPTILAAGLHRTEGIALDDSAVYVTDLEVIETARLTLLKVTR